MGTLFGCGALFAMFGGAALSFAYTSHRSLDRSPRRIATEIGVLMIANLVALIVRPVIAQLI